MNFHLNDPTVQQPVVEFKLNLPNTLGDKETKHSLQCWEAKVKTYFVKDKRFNTFFPGKNDANWNTGNPSPYGLQPDGNLRYPNTHPIAK